ncbi:MAG: aminoglycoside phosphotransferase family protein, partial [Clostridia bacterium]|nr:aminoglycoside phosphotransferase family protein [Clostridia bacterium]
MIEIVKQILKNEKIDYTLLKKSEAGFSNEVYFIDDRYVLKICDGKKSHKLKKEITIYQNIKMENVPKYILHGEIEDKVYLIIEKIQGKSLYNVWHILSEEDRKHIIYLMCNILKEFSSQPHFYLEERYKSENWLQKWQKSFDINIPILKERNFDTALLEDFKANKLEKIMKQQNLKLLFNDAHFDNFILTNDKKLYLIDFDRVIYGSLDYELLILDSMLDNPFKFASLEEEAFVKEEDYK